MYRTVSKRIQKKIMKKLPKILEAMKVHVNYIEDFEVFEIKRLTPYSCCVNNPKTKQLASVHVKRPAPYRIDLVLNNWNRLSTISKDSHIFSVSIAIPYKFICDDKSYVAVDRRQNENNCGFMIVNGTKIDSCQFEEQFSIEEAPDNISFMNSL